ncbi:MAG: hypothetical protein K8T26_19275 [Lentisphaerae bacterium]|nr:hypothetical protein [Lentisphaerota bacterium]
MSDTNGKPERGTGGTRFSRLRALARVRRIAQGRARPAGLARRWLWPLLTAAFIVAQQRHYFVIPDRIAEAPAIRETSSIHEPHVFDYGLYYWGLVPVYSTVVLDNRADAALYSPDAAAKLLIERGDSLRMEYINCMRVGERMVKLMKYPLCLWQGSPYAVSHRGVMGTIYTLGLVLLAFALGRHAPFPLGVVLPVLLSASPFIAADIYRRSLTQTVLISASIYAMALLAPVVFDRRLRAGSALLRAALLAAVVVILNNIRSTPTAIYGGVALVILLYHGTSWPKRVALLVVALGLQAGFSRSFDAWWESRYREASAVVERLGGQPFRGERKAYHAVYHAIWCGLADFDRTYGYRWSDNQPEGYAWPILQARGADVESNADQMGYVAAGPYIEYLPGYGQVLRDRLLANIRADPVWYARIIGQRIRRLLFESDPAHLRIRDTLLTGPRSPWPYLGVLALVLALGLRGYAKLFLLSLPTLAVPLLVTTYGGQQLEFIGHLVLAAVGLTMLVRALAWPVVIRCRRHVRRAPCAG